MLDFFRSFYASLVGKIITILVAVLFIVGFSFLPYIMGSGGVPEQDAATVDGSKISINALNRYYSRLENEYEKLYGNKLTESEIKSLDLQGVALSSLIADKVLELKSGVFGIHVSKRFLARQIGLYPVFQKNGKFSGRLFKKILSANHMTPSQFENSLKFQIARLYIKNIIRQSFGITERQFSDNYSIDNKSVSFYIAFFKSKQNAEKFLKASILNLGGKNFKELAGKFNGALKSVPMYSEANLVRSSYFKNFGLTANELPIIYTYAPESVIERVFSSGKGLMKKYAVIKLKRVYFPAYISVLKSKKKVKASVDGSMLTQRQSYELQKEERFLYSFVDYLEQKSNVKINKKAFAGFAD